MVADAQLEAKPARKTKGKPLPIPLPLKLKARNLYLIQGLPWAAREPFELRF